MGETGPRQTWSTSLFVSKAIKTSPVWLTAGLQLRRHGVRVEGEFSLLQRRQFNPPEVEGCQPSSNMETCPTNKQIVFALRRCEKKHQWFISCFSRTPQNILNPFNPRTQRKNIGDSLWSLVTVQITTVQVCKLGGIGTFPSQIHSKAGSTKCCSSAKDHFIGTRWSRFLCTLAFHWVKKLENHKHVINTTQDERLHF